MILSRITHLPSTAVWAARHPLQSTGRVFGFARGVVVGGIGLVDAVRTRVPEQRPEPSSGTSSRAPRPSPEPEGQRGTSEARHTIVEETASTPGYVAPAPTHLPPQEPPIDVVEQALAAEQEEAAPTYGLQGEPHPVTREEEHEGAPMTRAELEELEEETAEGLGEDEEGEVLPDQGLLLDPAEAKAVRSEAEILREAAENDRG